ncbi:MAG: hypothetical protein V4604_08740 [Bacteroidota bacterium]
MIIRKIPNTGLVLVNESWVVLKDKTTNEFVFCSNLLEEQFRLETPPPVNHVLMTDENEFIVFLGPKSVFISNGHIVREEQKYYFKHSDGIKVYLDLTNATTLNYESDAGKHEYPLINSSVKLFLPSHFIQLVGSEKRVFSLSADPTAREWGVALDELTQSDTVYSYFELLEIRQKLYFRLASEKRTGVFCLDLQTGKEVQLYDDCSGFLVKDQQFVYSAKFRDKVCVIDTETDTFHEWDVHQLIQENGFMTISDHRAAASNGLLYFTQSLGADFAKVGILDTTTRQLKWKYDFLPENGAIGSIHLQGKYLFIHMQDNTLFVFEPELK